MADRVQQFVPIKRIGTAIKTKVAGDTPEVDNDTWSTGTNYAGTDVINMFKVNVDDEIDVGGTLVLGASLEAEEDSGAVTLVDMPVSATPAAGDEMSFTLKIDGNNILKIYAEADSAGGIQNQRMMSTFQTTGDLTKKISEATVDITAVHTCTIQVNIPSGAKLLGTQLRVDAALAAGETWNAQYVTGATETIATAAAVAQDTKVNTFFDENAATAIASAEVDITIQRSSNPGVDVFTAQGTIRAIVYYEEFATMANV